MDEEELPEIQEYDEDQEYDSFDTPIDKVVNAENLTTFIKNYDTNKKKYKTSNVLSKYEKTKILCERAQQIEDGSPPYIANFERFTTSYAIAVEEMNQKKKEQLRNGNITKVDKPCNVLSGSSTLQYSLTPMIKSLENTVQDTSHIVQEDVLNTWTRGGIPSRLLTRGEDN